MSNLPWFVVQNVVKIPHSPGSTLPRAARCSFAALGATRGTVFLDEFESNFPASMAINIAINMATNITHGYKLLFDKRREFTIIDFHGTPNYAILTRKISFQMFFFSRGCHVSFRGECLVFSFRKSTVYVYMTYYKWYNIWYDICYDVIKYNIMAYSTIQSTRI